SERIEKRIFKISLWAGMLFVAIEFIMAVYSSSQTVLMDAAFDAAELVVIAISLILTPLFYKPITEKRPFGYFQCESLFIIIKGFMMMSVTFSLLFSNLQLMMRGGNHVNNTQVFAFELTLAALSLVVLLFLRYYNGKISSPSAAAEIYGWKVDFLCGFGVALAFLVPTFLTDTSVAWIIPYFDQIVAIILVVFVIPEPIRMIVVAFKNLLLFAPGQEVSQTVRAAVDSVFAEHGYTTVFVDITQTGRKMWVAVTFSVAANVLSMPELQMVQQNVTRKLEEDYEDIEVEMIPTMENNSLKT
ncbi:MAG: cation transporter, partial [Angelakisella sp.]